jgi:hypothetical protein
MLFCIYVFHTEVGSFRWIDKVLGPLWSGMEVWVGKEILGIPYVIATQENGSGDKTADWIALFCILVIAVAATPLWLLIERARCRRVPDVWLRGLLRVVIRYTLAFALFFFGMAKVLMVQFSSPSGGQLLQRYGDSSPMSLVWTFMRTARSGPDRPTGQGARFDFAAKSRRIGVLPHVDWTRRGCHEP